MGPAELLSHVCKTLEEFKIPYIVTGSMATIAYGEPRLTNDIDIAYITSWARRLGLSSLWREVREATAE